MTKLFGKIIKTLNVILLFLIVVAAVMNLKITVKNHSFKENLGLNTISIVKWDKVNYVSKTKSGEMKDIYLPIKVEKDKKSDLKKICVTKKLPIIEEGKYFAVELTAGDVDVSIDDIVKYQYKRPRVPYFEKVALKSWHIVPMFPKDSGKKLSVHMYEPALVMSNTLIGGKNEIYLRILSDNIIGVFGALMVFVAGFILVFLYKTYPKREDEQKTVYYLGKTAVFVGIWMIFIMGFMQFFIKDRVMLNLCENISFFFVILGTIQLISSCVDNEYHFEGTAICAFYSIYTVVFLFLLLGAIDIEFMVMFYGVYSLICLGIVIFINVYNIVKYKAKFNRIKFSILLVVSILVVIETKEYISNATLLYPPLIIFMMGLCIYVGSDYISSIYNQMRDAKRAEYYKKLSTTDTMTGMLNKNDYIMHTENFSQDIKNNYNYGIVIDMNGLKNINDNYGHKEGDKAIKLVADSIKKSYDSEEYRLYRVGGDEFMILAKSNEGEINLRIEKMRELLKKESENLAYDITVAVGYEYFDKNSGEDIKDTIKKADEKMYEQKKILKSLAI